MRGNKMRNNVKDGLLVVSAWVVIFAFIIVCTACVTNLDDRPTATITLYSADGQEINKWENIKVEPRGNMGMMHIGGNDWLVFKVDGKSVIISGTFTVVYN
jgi:hypothetical protein